MNIRMPARNFRAGLFFRRARPLVLFLLLSLSGMQGGCGNDRGPGPPQEERTIQPVNEVLNEHAPGLMKIEGVVGVYAGALQDGASCIVVMLRDDGPEQRGEIPTTLGGYPVRVEVGGEIRPLK